MAIIVRIGNDATGNPISDRIIISLIVPPPIGTAVINRLATKAVATTCKIPCQDQILVPNKYTKNIILNTLPIIEPSLWKLHPNGIVVSAISSGTPIFFELWMLAGIQAAEEQVEIEVAVVGITYLKNLLVPSLPPAI